ncbi:MAG: SWIM zinc finger family protein [Anaerolineae bacterium]
MDSGMINKIEKAKRYAAETDRIHFRSFQVTFRGDNSTHEVTFDNGAWSCDCHFFKQRGVCSHTMALERILGTMVPVVTPTTAEEG